MNETLQFGDADAREAFAQFQQFLDATPALGQVWAQDAGDTMIRTLKARYAATKRGRETQPLRTFAAWCAAQPDQSNLLPEEHPVFRWAASVSLPEYFVFLAWQWFVREYGKGGQGSRKTQRDWLAHFDNSVRKRWGKLWYFGDNGFKLSADGVILAKQFPDEDRK